MNIVSLNMPIQLFKGKNLSMEKGNTLKKRSLAESPTAPAPSQTDGNKFERLYVWNPRRSADHDSKMSKEATVKTHGQAEETKKIKATNLNRRRSVMLRTLADPYHALLVNGAAVVDDIDTQREDQSHKSAEAAVFVADSPPHIEVAQRAVEQPMLNYLLGRQDPASHFFTQRYVRVPDNDLIHRALSTTPHSCVPASSRYESLLAAADMDPYAFELFRIWSRTGSIPILYRRNCCDMINVDPKYTWQASWPLMNAVIAGHALSEPAFTDRVMDTLAENVVKGVCADVTTITHLFSQTDAVPRVLQQFVVDRCVDSCVANLSNLDISELPSSFVALMLQTAMRRLSYPEQVLLVPECTYHTHKALEECYKRQTTPSDLRRSVRYEVQREKSRRDLADFLANNRDSHVKATDWEERRIKAREEEIGRRGHGKEPDEELFGGREEIFAADPSRDVNVGIKQTEEDVPSKQDDSSTPALFGTVQATGSVDEVKPEPLTRKVPSPPGELQGATKSAGPVDPMSRGTVLPSPSSRSTQSSPDSELRHAVEILMAYERLSSCPGAFPESRVGSLRSTSSRSGETDG